MLTFFKILIKITLGSLALLSLLGLLTISGCAIEGVIKINNSIDAFARPYDPNYRLIKTAYRQVIGDRSGAWIISTNINFIEILEKSKEFGRADESDQIYYKQTFIEIFNPPDKLEGYIIYRGDPWLGPRTLCYLECSSALAVKPGNPLVYFMIYNS